jgi:crotonobetaine/carnitine-CoA ligase
VRIRLEPKRRVLGALIEERARTHGDKVFLLFGDRRVTYRELNETVNRVANSLLQTGVQKGDRVCLMLPNCPEFLYTWFALGKIGAIEVPINTAYRGDFLSYIINNSEAKALVIDEQFVDRLKFVQEGLRTVEKVIVLRREGALPGDLIFPVMDFAGLYRGAPTDPGVPVSNKDVLAFIYTSGTTGPSKGVMCQHNYFIVMAEDNLEARDAREDDVFYTCLPLFHANAQALTVAPVLVGGLTLALGERFSASTFWEELRRYGATQFNAIGAMLAILWKQPETPGERQHRVRLCFGAPIPPHVLEHGPRRWGIQYFLEGFGLTESGIIAYAPLDAPRAGSFGKALPYYDVRIVDDDGEEVPPGVVGEIVSRPLRPYTMMLGYYKMPEKTLEAFENLWFHTGDYGKREEDGYLYFIDRKKDALRRRGENISSFEVERIVNGHPQVAESAAVGIPSELGEDDVKICVVLKPGGTLTPEELLRWCEERMPYFMVPRYVEFMESLPKTPTERVEKYKLRQAGVTSATWDREKAGYKLKR